MDLRQLEYFVAVASEKNFTRAAGRLHIVQSGLSASIRALEEELGAALLIRTTRRVELTPIGSAFLAEANRVLAAAADARHVVDEMRGVHRGTLTIGMFHALVPLIDIAHILGRFRAAYPGVEIRMASGGSLKLIQGVQSGELDLALAQLSGPAPPGVSARMLACEPLAAICPPGHPLAARVTVALSELLDEVFVDLHPDWGTRQLIDRSFAEQRLARRTGFEVNDLSTQLDLVARGLGIALLPKALVADRIGAPGPRSVSVVVLAEPEIWWELAVVFAHDEQRQPASATARMFLDLLPSSAEMPERSERFVGAAAIEPR
jgi:DNA-binding transcriptional LysR family regulator